MGNCQVSLILDTCFCLQSRSSTISGIFWFCVYRLEIDNPFITASETTEHTAACAWLAVDQIRELLNVTSWHKTCENSDLPKYTVLKKDQKVLDLRPEAIASQGNPTSPFILFSLSECLSAHVPKASGITGVFHTAWKIVLP